MENAFYFTEEGFSFLRYSNFCNFSTSEDLKRKLTMENDCHEVACINYEL